MDDGDVEALTEFFPDVGSHAVAPGHAKAVLSFEGVDWGVEKVATELADVLEVCGVTLRDFGPEGLMGESLAQTHCGAGVDDGCRAETLCGSVVEGKAGVEFVAGF